MSAGVRSGVGHSSGGLKRKVLLMGASGSGKVSRLDNSSSTTTAQSTRSADRLAELTRLDSNF